MSAPAEVEVNFQAHLAIDPDNPSFEMLAVNPGFDGPRLAFSRESAPQTEDDAPPEETRLNVARSGNQGQDLDQPVQLASALDASEPVPYYDRVAGEFHVVYHDNRHGDLDIFYTSSPDGSTWSGSAAPGRRRVGPVRGRGLRPPLPKPARALVRTGGGRRPPADGAARRSCWRCGLDGLAPDGHPLAVGLVRPSLVLRASPPGP